MEHGLSPLLIANVSIQYAGLQCHIWCDKGVLGADPSDEKKVAISGIKYTKKPHKMVVIFYIIYNAISHPKFSLCKCTDDNICWSIPNTNFWTNTVYTLSRIYLVGFPIRYTPF